MEQQFATEAGLLDNYWNERPAVNQAPKLVMAHQSRDRVLACIAETPGSTFRGLMRTTGIAAGTLRHHLNQLILSHQIWVLQVGISHWHYLGRRPSMKHELYDALLQGLDAPCSTVLDHLRRVGQSTQGSLVAGLQNECGMPRSMVQRVLLRLWKFGLITIQARGRYKLYEVVKC